MAVFGRVLALACIGIVAACASEPVRSRTPDPTAFLIQMVCVDAADTPVFADPVACPERRRKLRPGEPLPYHKLDVGGYQISDSVPVDDPDGLTLGVQTYFFTDAFDLDPAFPGRVRLDPARGGYNIMGASGDWVAFLGTSDPGAYWQPWWRPDCALGGWRLFPNGADAFEGGEAASPTTFAPGCEGRIRTSAATVEWDFVPDHPYVVDPAEETTTRRLDSLRVRHFAAGHGSMETNWFTREYGATRWEAWRAGTGLTPGFLKDRCPASTYDATFHGRSFSMVDCRTWTTLVRPQGGTWDPDGTSDLDPTIRTFPIDPLYTTGNLLMNTHVGGPYVPDGSFSCDERGWRAVPTPSPLIPGEVTGPPWNANGTCIRTIMAERVPAGAYVQTIEAPAASERPYRYGVSLFGPELAEGASTAVEVRVVQHDATGLEVARASFRAAVIDRYRAFEGTLQRDPRAARMTFEVSPLGPGVPVAVTGAFIAAR